jgi:hypothetical protein
MAMHAKREAMVAIASPPTQTPRMYSNMAGGSVQGDLIIGQNRCQEIIPETPN